jgi:hypothetical protein
VNLNSNTVLSMNRPIARIDATIMRVCTLKEIVNLPIACSSISRPAPAHAVDTAKGAWVYFDVLIDEH